MATNDKDTIYIDIDDEITGVIDKVKSSSGKVVALVLPKRANVFQSSVNMKLLKRAADASKQHLVLITSEAGLLPLAGAAGIHVAKTLTSKPEIPLAPAAAIDDDEAIGEDEPVEITADNAGDRPIGDLAGGAAAASALNDNDVETVELDNAAPAPEADEAAGAGAAVGAAAAAKKPKKDKKLAVPNFERFRLLMVAGVLALILLIGGLIAALTMLPKATISIKTDAVNVPVNTGLRLSTTASELSLSSDTVPAKVAQQQKTYTQQATASGQKNVGNKAQGSVTMSAGSCSGNIPDDVPQGTALTSNGQTFILGDDVQFVPAVSRGHCTFQGMNADGRSAISITAQAAGSSYNVNGSFSVYHRSDISASGSASGGTDNNVQVVTQSDINNAKNKISTSDESVKQALDSQLKGDNYYPIDATFSGGNPTITTSANPGDTASSVTVTEAVSYTMFGARQDDLKTLLDSTIKQQIDTHKQALLDDGLSKASFNVTSSSTSNAEVTMSTTAEAGPDLDTNSIKQMALGKKSGQVRSQLQTNPDVTGVDVKLSPFWVTSVPKKASRVTVHIAQPTTTKS